MSAEEVQLPSQSALSGVRVPLGPSLGPGLPCSESSVTSVTTPTPGTRPGQNQHNESDETDDLMLR